MSDRADPHAIPGSQPVLRSDVLSRKGDNPNGSPDRGSAVAPQAAPGASLPGVYALDRFEAKDVCRVALDPKPGGAATSETSRDLAPARLLPGCHDSGITVFDPISWRFASGHITLKSKRGHAINLVATHEGSWRRDPDVGTTFVLRKVE